MAAFLAAGGRGGAGRALTADRRVGHHAPDREEKMIMEQILLTILLTVLFAIGAKIALHFKNREMAMIKEQYERELLHCRAESEKVRAALSDDLYRQIRRTEEVYQSKLNEKDEQIRALVGEIEALKAWKEEIGLKMAEFKGAAQGNPQMLIFKLLEHNQKLNRALLQKWESLEKSLSTELTATLDKLRSLFRETEALHRDGLEIISLYEARLPDDLKRQVREEMLKLPRGAGVPELPER
ncbi:MAG: hypothetical protein OZSIB_0136 [Candidatus Ozemobacter sibiricus]|uniref:Uncharacterized protein n=1 Tax=Candidatus Ozemobacter sibiricus TaxID=2268124 RepID=A0A367ZMB2_9BACT|nr:MAG: hypothetical protein OZSIB_0136 [Candidatus Ozemobacter sibiricus]